MIGLTAKNQTEQRVLDYLNANASDVLTVKINAGKKTLVGALDYAKNEAKKLASGESCVCVDDATVFGWIIHYFEEDHITEKAKAEPRIPAGVAKTTQPKPTPKIVKKVVEPDPTPKQLTMFDALLGGATT